MSDYAIIKSVLVGAGYSPASDEDSDHVVWTKRHSPCNLQVVYHRQSSLADLFAVFPCGPDGLWSEYRVFGMTLDSFMERLQELERLVVNVVGQLYYIESEG
jgi:hypothetical protein